MARRWGWVLGWGKWRRSARAREGLMGPDIWVVVGDELGGEDGARDK